MRIMCHSLLRRRYRDEIEHQGWKAAARPSLFRDALSKVVDGGLEITDVAEEKIGRSAPGCEQVCVEHCNVALQNGFWMHYVGLKVSNLPMAVSSEVLGLFCNWLYEEMQPDPAIKHGTRAYYWIAMFRMDVLENGTSPTLHASNQ